MIKFTEHQHLYEDIAPGGNQWLSVTTAVGKLKEKFDPKPAAEKAARNSKSKWYKLPLEEILKAWEDENLRSRELGSWYHRLRENQLYTQENELTIVVPDIRDGVKYAGEQKLQDNTIYPEHLVYLPSAGICGQADYVEVRKNILTIRDYKTSKEIKRNGFKNWEGVTSKLLPPLQHLENCEFNHYAIQLSIYAYMISRWNPLVNIGKLIIEHVRFEEEGLNKYGYPIYKKDANGEFIVREVEIIEVPYLRSEVITLFNYLKSNK